MNRRSFLASVGVAAVGGGLGYQLFLDAGQEGRVFWRRMAADTHPGTLFVMTEMLDDDGTVYSHVHSDYEGKFEDGLRVPEALHAELRRRYGDDEPYYLIRYQGHDCNGIPGDEGGNAIEVSRSEFNRLQIGDCVKK